MAAARPKPKPRRARAPRKARQAETETPRQERQARLALKEDRSRYAEALVYNPKTGQWDRDYGRRPRRWKGAQVNEPRPLPQSPDPQIVTKEECFECGELYKRWQGSGCSLADAEPTGPYRSRGTLLWSLRLCKMREWYTRHLACVEYSTDPEARRVNLPPAMVWSLIHGSGEIPPRVRLDRDQLDFVEGYQTAIDTWEPIEGFDEYAEEVIPF